MTKEEAKRQLQIKAQEIVLKYGQDIIDSPLYRRCAKFRHHYTSNCMAHCGRVTQKAVEMALKKNMNVDYSSLVRGCLLHDYYLYEFTTTHKFGHLHCHGKWAMQNADRDFGLNKKEKNMIKAHMWPFRIWDTPRSKEAWLLCLADKKVGNKEFLAKKEKKAEEKK